ncbi:ATP-binding cassette domain-containing protein [Aerococcaceae bacterium DSM 111020]|nr:ATP-binding cassette domain-containing protein [Aerococcaceae bacterium DSM 111020]
MVTPLLDMSRIDVEDLTFAYYDKTILSHFNLNIKSGDKVLVIGPSGSGKSTLLEIIHGFLMPQSGQVTLEANNKVTNQSLTEFDSVSIIQQDPVIFNETIRFNVSFSNDPSHDQELMKLLDQLNLVEELGAQPLDLMI